MLYGIIIVLAVINFFALILYGIDKLMAIKHRRRISEASLLTLALLGGWVGSFIAQCLFRHKISKRSFQFRFWAIVLVEAALLSLWVLLKWDIF